MTDCASGSEESILADSVAGASGVAAGARSDISCLPFTRERELNHEDLPGEAIGVLFDSVDGKGTERFMFEPLCGVEGWSCTMGAGVGSGEAIVCCASGCGAIEDDGVSEFCSEP